MLTSKQRAELRAKANGIETIFQVGKGGVGDNLITQVNDALAARELIKLRVLESALMSASEAAALLAEEVGADVVQCIGSRFVLYRKRPEEALKAPVRAERPRTVSLRPIPRAGGARPAGKKAFENKKERQAKSPARLAGKSGVKAVGKSGRKPAAFARTSAWKTQKQNPGR